MESLRELLRTDDRQTRRRAGLLVLALVGPPLLAGLGLVVAGPEASTLSATTLAITASILRYLDARIDSHLLAAPRSRRATRRMASVGWTVAAAIGTSMLCLGPVTDDVLALAGGALLAVCAAARLADSVRRHGYEADELRERLCAVQLGQRADRARLHEINATVAGIASAQRLLADGRAHDRSEALTAMMRAEIERLHRLVSGEGPVRQRGVELDEVVEQIVLAHVARGRDVTWEPSGLRVLGRGDDIAEVLNVLLENAAVHAAGAPVRISVEHDDASVTLTVSDEGPGVPAAICDRIFDWGVQGPDSPGQGIGLHTASDVAADLGGRLELLPTQRGATFALRLRPAPREVPARDRVAHAG